MDKDDLKKRIADHAILRQHLPEDFNASVDTFFEMAGFHYGVYEAMEEECMPKLRQLTAKHYPALATGVPAMIEKDIEETNGVTVFSIAYIMRGLVRSMNEGIDIAEKYPKIEEWREYYLHPKPETVNDSYRNRFLYADDAQWAKHIEEENQSLYRLFCWEEYRKKEFYDIVQPPLFKLYPVLNELEGDFWVLYAVNLRDEYECWLTVMEHTESIIELELPPESVQWEDEKYREEVKARYPKYRGIWGAERKRQIDGFDVKLYEQL